VGSYDTHVAGEWGAFEDELRVFSKTSHSPTTRVWLLVRAHIHETPQGGVISPLLANIYLDPLDWLMAGFGFEMVRYADDMVVMCRSHEEAETALEKLREWMAGAGLTLHPDKTRTVDMTVADSHFELPAENGGSQAGCLAALGSSVTGSNEAAGEA